MNPYKFDPGLRPLTDTELETLTGPISPNILTYTWVTDLISWAVTATKWAMRLAPRGPITAAAVYLYTNIYNKNPDTAQKLLNEFNEIFESTDERIQDALNRLQNDPQVKVILPANLNVAFIKNLIAFGIEIRNRAIPKLPGFENFRPTP